MYLSNLSLSDQIIDQIYLMCKIFLSLVLLAALSLPANTLSFYNQIKVSNKTTAASCLDGTQYGFYLWQPDNSSTIKPVNKLLIYFEETPFGWCVEQDLSSSIEKCFKFITEDNLIDFGSSQNWTDSVQWIDGIRSFENAGNFNGWTKVVIKSCDGGAFMGDRDPITFKRRKLHFKGSVNTIETFKILKQKGLMDGKDQIVISGSMGGAIAAMQWAQTLKEYTTTPVRLLVDSGLHLIQYNRKNNETVIQNRLMMLDNLFMESKGGPNQACNAANKDQMWKCFFGIELYKYIKMPILFTQSLYDGWSHQFILGISCSQLGTLSECKQEEREVLEEYYKNITAVVRQVSKADNVSMYAIACVCHEMTGFRWLNDDFEVPMLSGNHPENIANQWLGIKKVVVIDEVTWPDNKPCAFKTINTHHMDLKSQ